MLIHMTVSQMVVKMGETATTITFMVFCRCGWKDEVIYPTRLDAWAAGDEHLRVANASQEELALYAVSHGSAGFCTQACTHHS